jgi:allantoinase
VLELVASDHSPCSPNLKAMEQGDFMAAWGGVAGLQLALPVVWTEASARGFGLREIVRWMCERTAALAGLGATKGAIAAGRDADLVVFADDERAMIRPENVQHRHKVTPYAGETLRGVVHATYLRGMKVAERGTQLATDLGQLV